jgi:peptidoglycan/xylan/chitin deacetylase (PgdA/CDA1 family)
MKHRRIIAFLSCLFLLLNLTLRAFSQQILKKPIPDHLVVLTFDDAVSTDYTTIAPILKKYGFGATFFVTEFPDFKNKHYYMSWQQIKDLNEMGFEIGNHTDHHHAVSTMDRRQFIKSLDYIKGKCNKYNIPKPVDFAYPGWDVSPYSFKVLNEKGYLFARAGGNRPYNPRKDYPYLVPSYNVGKLDSAQVIKAVKKAKKGKIVVLTIHGVPDYAHPWVTTLPALFKAYMKYLYTNHYKVIALVHLEKYINVKRALHILMPHINDRIQNIKK